VFSLRRYSFSGLWCVFLVLGWKVEPPPSPYVFGVYGVLNDAVSVASGRVRGGQFMFSMLCGAGLCSGRVW
jgi:hypothetical protein